MARNQITTRPRELWQANVAPLVTAAREGARAGASRATETARRQRDRRQQARQPTPWWRRRWVAVTAGGLVVAATAGWVYAAVTRSRRARDELPGSGPDPEPTGGGLRSTVSAGRARVADTTRNVLDRLRSDQEPSDPIREPAPAPADPPAGARAGTPAGTPAGPAGTPAGVPSAGGTNRVDGSDPR